jgi:hypothetical protein
MAPLREGQKPARFRKPLAKKPLATSGYPVVEAEAAMGTSGRNMGPTGRAANSSARY